MSVQVTLTFTTVAEAAAFLAGARPADTTPSLDVAVQHAAVEAAKEHVAAKVEEGKGKGGRRKKQDAEPAQAPADGPSSAPDAAASTTHAEVGNGGAATAAAASTASAESAGATSSPTAGEPVVEQKPFEYATLQASVFKLAHIDKQAVMDLAASFGQKTFKTLSADRWEEAHKAVEAKIVELSQEDLA